MRANHAAGRQASEPAEDWGSTVSWLSTAVATAEPYGARHQLHAVSRQIPSVPRRKAPAPPRPVPAHHSSSRKEIVDIPPAMIAEALAELRPAYRESIVETYFRGRTVEEAAQVLGIPADTVKARLYRALDALRAAVAESQPRLPQPPATHRR